MIHVAIIRHASLLPMTTRRGNVAKIMRPTLRVSHRRRDPTRKSRAAEARELFFVTLDGLRARWPAISH